MRKNIKTIIITLIASLFLAGCFSAQHIKQNKYMLHIQMPKKTKTLRNAKTLQLTEPLITPQFSNNSFVYRISNTQYQTDYYNIFFIPAFQQVRQLLTQYLTRQSFIHRVIGAPSVIGAQYVLSTDILDLYADYRNTNNPTGVVTIQFSLYKHLSGKYYLIMHKTLSESTPLKQKDSTSLVNAWSAGLQRIFKKLSIQLRKVL